MRLTHSDRRYAHPVAEILYREGAQGLVRWLRDSMPWKVLVPQPVPPRQWIKFGGRTGADREPHADSLTTQAHDQQIRSLANDPSSSSYSPPFSSTTSTSTSFSTNPQESHNTISLMSYNILCEKYATQQQYWYTPSWSLVWPYRCERILKEILHYNADVVCVQEMDWGQYEDWWHPRLCGSFPATSIDSSMQALTVPTTPNSTPNLAIAP